MSSDGDLHEAVQPCRTCGVYYLTTSNFLRNLFGGGMDSAEMASIRQELAAWNIEPKENDGYPQYICTTCIYDFERMFKLRRSCKETATQWLHFYHVRMDMIKIKREKPDPEEQESFFIYVDDLTDDEADDKVITPFNFPHVPIKLEAIESAKVPADVYVSRENDMPTQIDGATPVPPNASDSDGESREFIDMHPAKEIDEQPAANEEEAQKPTDAKDRQCTLCGKEFKNWTLNRLHFHMVWHKRRRHIKCPSCSFYCNSKAAMRGHTQSAHPLNKCPHCKKRIQKKLMSSHLQECPLNENKHVAEWPCEYCYQVCSSPSDLEQHQLSHHGREDSGVMEPLSGENLLEDDEPDAEQFDGDCDDEAIIVCAVCEKAFASALELEVHVRQTHRNSSTSDYVEAEEPDESDMEFEEAGDSEMLLQDAVEVSGDEMEEYSDSDTDLVYTNTFTCSTCACSFEDIEQLKIHAQVHTKKPEFKCDECGRTFDLKFSLNRHLAMHKKTLAK